MKKVVVSLSMFMVFAGASFFQYRNSADKAEKVEADRIAALQARGLKAAEGLKGTLIPQEKTQVQAKLASQQEFSEADFLRLYHDTDFARSMATAVLVERLEAQKPAVVAEYLQNLLEHTGSRDMEERGRLMILANELRSSELIPFWIRVLERSPKALENENQLVQSPEPNPEALAIRVEISLAIRNLGLQSLKEGTAQDALAKYVGKADPAFDNTIFRKEAYYAIREFSTVAAVKLLRGLGPSDPLKASLALD